MAKFTNCLQIVNAMPEQDQESLLARLDELQGQGLSPKDAQLQAAIDVLMRVKREAAPSIRKSEGRLQKPVLAANGTELVVYRGELSGNLYNIFDRRSTDAGVGFFFAENQEQAEGYAGRGTSPRQFKIYADRVLDLTNPYGSEQREFLKGYEAEFDEWIDRSSGEATSASEMLEAGSLYDYEGTGSGRRWNALFRIAEAEGFNAVRVLDSTDGVPTSPVWVVFEPNQAKLIDNLEPTANPDITKSSSRTDTKNFKRWSNNAPLVRLGDKHEFKSGEPIAVEALHGTTNADITEFMRSRANIESDFGAGFYASNTPEDVAHNYANVDGPDLTARIERETERLADSIDSDDATAYELIADYLRDTGSDLEVSEDTIGDLKDEYAGLAADHAARKRLSQGTPNTMKLFMRFKNPAVLGGKGETFFDYNEPYNEDTDEYGEPTGLLVDFMGALDGVASEFNVWARDVERAKSDLLEAAEGDGVSFQKLQGIIRERFADAYSDDFEGSGTSEALRRTLSNIGFDGVIDTTVNAKFGPRKIKGAYSEVQVKGMPGMTPDTVHFIAFEPEQIKSATGNNGEYGETGNILKSTPRPQFYSQLQRAIEQVPERIATMAAPQWKLWLDSNGPKLGVKKDEIEWSGIKDYLDLQGKAKLGKADLAAYLDESGVKVSEVMLGGAEEYAIYDDNGQLVLGGFAARDEGEAYLEDNYGIESDGWSVRSAASGDATKYAQYTLPGGTNYREVLITLPSKATTAPEMMYRTGNDIRAKLATFVEGGFSADAVEAAAAFTDDGGSVKQGLGLQDQLVARGYGYTQAQKESGQLMRALLSGQQKRVDSAMQDAAKRNYRSSHWDQPNVLAHIRVNDRTDADGKRVLFVEEVQSDWGQEGKKGGFIEDVKPTGEITLTRDGNAFVVANNGIGVWSGLNEQRAQEVLAEQQARGLQTAAKTGGVPLAPFVTKTENWLNLALKRIAMMAVEGGYDKVAFVNGEQSADRYDLSKKIESVEATKTTQGKYAVTATSLDGREVVDDIYDQDGLPDVVGKELADRIVNEATTSAKPGERHSVQYRGLDLKVGGRGMITFYDEIVPQAINKLLPKIGGEKLSRVDFGKAQSFDDYLKKRNLEMRDGKLFVRGLDVEMSLPAVKRQYEESRSEAKLSGDQPGFAITEKMRDTAGQGLPLFSRRRAYHGTPHRGIEKFSTDKIGTGEGAQAYGWGLYFASKREIAEYYRKTLIGKNTYSIDGKQYSPQKNSEEHALAAAADGDLDGYVRHVEGMKTAAAGALDTKEYLAKDAARLLNIDLAAMRSFMGADKSYAENETVTVITVDGEPHSLVNEKAGATVVSAKSKVLRELFERDMGLPSKSDKASMLDFARNLDGKSVAQAGQVYEVEIPGDDEMLLWDKSLSEQPEGVRKALENSDEFIVGYWAEKSAENPAYDGNDLYKRLTGTTGSDKAASEYLAALGIKGIKYLDGTSRADGDGSFNYVIFSGDDVTIERVLYSRSRAYALPMAGDVVDGLAVRSGVPNASSIAASLDDYEAVPGIREVPFSLFSGPDAMTPRTRKLAADIEESEEIAPLIVVFDGEGPYILEGAHRFDALQHIGKKSFPAKVVVDLKEIKASRKRNPQEDTQEFKDWFRDSKVVDAEGKPLVVYHGTKGDLEDVSGTLLWVTPSKELAATLNGRSRNPVALYAKASKIFDPNNDDHVASISKAMDKRFGNSSFFDWRDRIKNHWKVWDYAEARAAVQSAGFDAIESQEDGNRTIALIGDVSGRVKSATGNSGAFDPANPDIRKSTGRTATGADWGSPSASKFDDMVYKLQDRSVDTKRVVDAIKDASGAIADDLNVYLQEELYHGRAAKRAEDFVNNELNPLVEQMAKEGLTIADVEEYMHARHAPEANAVIAQRNPGVQDLQDGGSGMTNSAAATYMAALSAADKAKLEAAAAKVDAIIAKTREMYVDYELESQETVDGWASVFKHYIPLQREDKDGSPGIGQGFSVKGREAKGRTGSTRKVVDVLANVALQRERAITRGEKDRVARALVGLAESNPNPDFWTVDEVPTERVFNPSTGLVEDRPDPMYKSRPNTVVAKVMGDDGRIRERAVVFNEEDPRALRMAEALKNLDATKLEGLMGVSAVITRYFAASVTQWNPLFGPVNLIRDVQAVALNLSSTPLRGQERSVMNSVMPALAGVYKDLRAARKGKATNSPWARLWDEFQSVGGQTGYRDLFKNSAERAESIQKTLDPDGWADSKLGKVFTAGGALKVPMVQARRSAGWLFDWLSDYNDALENGVRLAVYKAALDKGLSKEQAASIAKNASTNFNRKGQIGQQAGALYAFFNAAVQGTTRMGETLFDMEPGKPKTIRLSKTGKMIVSGGVLLGALQAVMLAAAGFDDEDPPQFARERALIIPIGDKKYLTIPMPLGFNVIPNIGRIATEFAMGGFKKPHERSVQLLSLFSETFNPIGSAGLSMQTLAPTALDPLVALTENKDWTGKPIARESSNKALPGHALAKDTASTWSKLIAEGVNTLSGGNKYVAGVFSPSPDQIDYLLGWATGGVGREISKLDQTVTSLVSGEELPPYKVPLVGRFYGNAKSQASEGTAFYANAADLNKLETEIKGLEKDGKTAEAAAMRRSSDAYLITMANQAERQIQKLRSEKRELVKQGAPRERIAAVETQITGVMARLNRAAEALREKATN